MKNISLLFVAMFVLCSFAKSQTIIFSDSIRWQNSKNIVSDDNKMQKILSFVNSTPCDPDFLPVYRQRFPVSGRPQLVDYQIVNAKYEPIPEADLTDLKFLEKIDPQPQINIFFSVFRKQNFINFELMPVKKNLATGIFERLTYYEVRINYTVLAVKNAATYVTTSALSAGRWYKIKVATSGIYKLTYAQLAEMGFADMSHVGIFGYGGILPTVPGNRPVDDLPELPVYQVDANDNDVFDNGDYLLFWADNQDQFDFTTAGCVHHLNTFTDYACYFVSDQGSLKSPTKIASLPHFTATTDTYDDCCVLEKDSVNVYRTGRHWLWRHFDYYLDHTLSTTIPNLSLSDSVKIEFRVVATSVGQSSFTIIINGMLQEPISVNPPGIGATDYYAREQTKSYMFKPDGDNFTFSLHYNKEEYFSSQAWLDYIALHVRRKLQLHNGFVRFRDTKTVGNAAAKFNLTADQNTIVWDITNRFDVQQIDGSYVSGIYSFNAKADKLHEYVAFNPLHDFPSPLYKDVAGVGVIENQNLHAPQNVDLIIISPENFLSSARALQKIHSDFDGMKSVVVTQEQIYNEFSSGRKDASAIRDYIKMFYDRAATANEIPRNVILLGDGSYDNKSDDISNCVVTFETFESLLRSRTFVIDDFFVILDDGEDSDNANPDIDMGIGRIPVKTPAEAAEYVEKVRSHYELSNFGSYKNSILMVADDAEKGQTVHQVNANELALWIEQQQPVYNVERLFLDDYEQEATVQGHRYPEVNRLITDNIQNGVQIVQWVGHGNYKSWAHEYVLTIDMIKSLSNVGKYPLFITSTCEFTPFDNHALVSAGEELLLNPHGGGIAMMTSTRVAFSGSNEQLAHNFYAQMFTVAADDKVETLGLAMAKAKNMQVDYNKKTFVFLGDPVLRAFSPERKVFTTKINGVPAASFTDTLRAMSKVSIEGIVGDRHGNIDNSFNGIVYPVVYDKRRDFTTRGNDGFEPLNYTAQKNILFKGKATVVNGKFKFSFIVPVDIAYFYDYGKISYYANNQRDTEAHGYDNSFVIGGSDSTINDKTGPEISLFLNDENFVSGGLTNESPTLIAKLEDQSGINTVGNGIGHDVTLVIDDETANSIVLNKFYESEIDNFTKGAINYKISDLEMGPHTLSLKAWDVVNNSNKEAIDFIVANSADLAIEHIFNYPNPFSTSTSFYFDHNRPYENLDVVIQIFTITGKHVKTIETTVFSTGFRSVPILWDGKDSFGDKIAKGVYVYEIKVRTPDGQIADKFEKLVILN